ncbi:L,D-transpeptidase [Pelagibacterium limicola]|uniref:L,D-transpeptidase n=1 Tax=Pelagibacterium limicola TaxID=2791022 RepID=UPI001FE88C6C|nr:L,D-transpeptidase [Pelagibacterium limicola]
MALAGCTSTTRTAPQPVTPQYDPFYVSMYGPLPNEKFPVPAVDLRYLDPQYYRRVVDDPTGERPGTLVVDTASRYLYLVREGRQAIRYGVGIGRDGFSWSGRGYISYKREWPTWTPPAAMIAREPHLEEWRHGQPGGLDNPLGARALYIFQNGRDTLYRVHGSGEPWSIGSAVSSGCVRLLHHDVIDLYNRVSSGAPILVA